MYWRSTLKSKVQSHSEIQTNVGNEIEFPWHYSSDSSWIAEVRAHASSNYDKYHLSSSVFLSEATVCPQTDSLMNISHTKRFKILDVQTCISICMYGMSPVTAGDIQELRSASAIRRFDLCSNTGSCLPVQTSEIIWPSQGGYCLINVPVDFYCR